MLSCNGLDLCACLCLYVRLCLCLYVLFIILQNISCIEMNIYYTLVISNTFTIEYMLVRNRGVCIFIIFLTVSCLITLSQHKYRKKKYFGCCHINKTFL